MCETVLEPGNNNGSVIALSEEVTAMCITEYNVAAKLSAEQKEAEIYDFIRLLKEGGLGEEEIAELVCEKFGFSQVQASYYYQTLSVGSA